MGEKALVESQVVDAIELIKKLDAVSAAPTLAVWYFYDDAAEWKLLLAGRFLTVSCLRRNLWRIAGR